MYISPPEQASLYSQVNESNLIDLGCFWLLGQAEVSPTLSLVCSIEIFLYIYIHVPYVVPYILCSNLALYKILQQRNCACAADKHDIDNGPYRSRKEASTYRRKR